MKKLLFIIMANILAASFSFAQISQPLKNQSPVNDVLSQADRGSVKITGLLNDKIYLAVSNIEKKIDYKLLADCFHKRTNQFAFGEFWGKMMRAGCLAYKYTQDAELKSILENAVNDLLSAQTPDGCISARSYDKQPYSSDLWERKYVLLGLEFYYENVSKSDKVLNAMIKEVDYTIGQVGPSPKVSIVDTGWAFEGIESSSILEPVMKLYNLTGYQRYLDFAKYIVETEGACKRGSIFEAAFNGVNPKDICDNGNPKQSIAKSYESMSCFEGLLEYYRVTGNDHWKTAALSYFNKLRDQEMTIIGSGSCNNTYNFGPGDGEQWNFSGIEQTNPKITKMQETCTTVTWMKLCYQLLRLTGDPRFADQIERTAYNALLGAYKPGGYFFDYFSMLNGARNTPIGFKYKIGQFPAPVTCCSANGVFGLALIPFTEVMKLEAGDGLAINLYNAGQSKIALANGHQETVRIESDYPKTGNIVINVTPQQKEKFKINLRIPEWSVRTVLKVNGTEVECKPGSYAVIERVWTAGDKIDLQLDMRGRLVKDPGSRGYVAIMRGPVVLARDLRSGGNIDEPVKITANADGYINLKTVNPSTDSQTEFSVPAATGEFRMIEYASAGNTWDNTSRFKVWLTPAN